MKSSQLLFYSFVVLLLSALTASAELASAKVIATTGTVTKYNSSGQTRIAPGAILKEGDSLTTGPLGSTKLIFSNGSELTVKANSSFEITELQQEAFNSSNSYEQLQADPSRSQTLLELNYGELEGHVKKLRSDSKFHIQTPLGTAGIRGTRWSATLIYNAVRGEFTLTVTNFDGLVDIMSRYAGGVTFTSDKTATKSVNPTLSEVVTEQLPQDHTISLTIAKGDPGFDQLINLIQNIPPNTPTPVITPTSPSGTVDNDSDELVIIVTSPEGPRNQPLQQPQEQPDQQLKTENR